jgi:hypothetical protein
MTPPNPPKSAAPPAVLNGWKDIANYLGKGVRTIQRYEIELGLPVRRPARKVKGSVFATVEEIDAWVNGIPRKKTFAGGGTSRACCCWEVRAGA